ncbi:MAG TPA: adenylate kinase [Limnochordales bacterium]
MRAVMLGMPGAGKGTQAERLARELGIPHISTGAIFRDAVQRGTDLGKQAKAYMDRGELVPDAVTVAIVRERLQAPDCRRGFVLDGFPRNLEQARALDEALAREGLSIDAAINLVVPAEEAVRRITSRRVCSRCGATYGAGELAASGESGGDVCPRCGGQLVQRDDDREEVVRQRLRVYEESTRPLIDYYAARGVLVEVPGTGGVDEVAEAVGRVLRERGLGIDRG